MNNIYFPSNRINNYNYVLVTTDSKQMDGRTDEWTKWVYSV